MGRRAAIFRSETSNDEALALANKLKAVDHALMDIVASVSCRGRGRLNAETAGRLAHIQRQLRALRIDMEVERRFDTAPVTLDQVRRRVPGGGLQL